MLTTKGRYAVMAMVDVAMYGQGKPVTLADIAERQEITQAYLEQLFSKLKKAGLVESVRGPGGGYLLAHDCNMITIADIILAQEEKIKMTRCNHSHQGCMSNKARCLTHDVWAGLSENIYSYLSGITLARVCSCDEVLPVVTEMQL